MLFIRKSCLLALALVTLSLSANGADTPPAVAIPGGVDVVVSINVRKLLDSGLFKKYGSDVVAKGMSAPEVKGMLDATGINPTKDIESIVLATPLEMNSKRGVIIVKGKFDESKIKAFAEVASKEGAFKFKTSKEGDVTFHEIIPAQQPDSVYATFTDKSTILVGGEKDYLLTLISGKADKPTGKLSTLLGKLNGKESITMVAVMTDDMKRLLGAMKGLEGIAPKLETGLVTVNVADGIDVKAVLGTINAKAVEETRVILSTIVATIRASSAGNPNLQAALGKIKMVPGPDKSALTISLSLSGADIQKLAGR